MSKTRTSKVKVAILGASGYSGEELIRLLVRHPGVEINAITSRQYAGKGVEEVFPRFSGTGLVFSAPDVDKIAASCDAAFLALPHGLAAEFAIPLMKKGVKVIDISADFRLKSKEKYFEYYKHEHPAPELLKDAVYGLPERYRRQIRDAKLISCPGCYPTSIILPLSVLLSEKLVSNEGIVVASMSGVSGAGRKVELPFIFPECNESVRAYSPSGHRHLPEIEQELAFAADMADIKINFIPHLVPINRGISSTIICRPAKGVGADSIRKAFLDAYEKETFVRVLPDGRLADTKNVSMTNICEFGFVLDQHTGRLVITSAIDNLTKGASGQAIQCLNIISGYGETEGLL